MEMGIRYIFLMLSTAAVAREPNLRHSVVSGNYSLASIWILLVIISTVKN